MLKDVSSLSMITRLINGQSDNCRTIGEKEDIKGVQDASLTVK